MKNKIFLYLYPIAEYASVFLYNDMLYDIDNKESPFTILNECIQKRYRDKGYQVVFVLYPDKEIFGLIPKMEDKIVYTDILFSENSVIDEMRRKKQNFTPKYPNEDLILEQLGDISELVVGGYHFSSCVKKVAESCYEKGIPTIVDLDMTDLFFSLYEHKDYFNVLEYSPTRFREFMINEHIEYGEEFAKRQFNRMYSSAVYGFSTIDYKKIR